MRELTQDRPNGAAIEGLKSYYIKTAVLWLVQDSPSGCWKGVTAGVRMTLHWLEDCPTVHYK